MRTILSVDEKDGSMTFAGELPEGAKVQLMRAHFDRLINGAGNAALMTSESVKDAQLGILISCVGRRLILGPRTEEEVEKVKEILGPQAKITGFYSYGEISPVLKGTACSLHNQTMTITTFKEKK